METGELLQTPLELISAIQDSLRDSDSFKQECLELDKRVEELQQKLQNAARVGTGKLYFRPMRRIMVDVRKTLEKTLALAKKCKRSGILKRVITITSAGDFKRVIVLLDNSVADVSWLLNLCYAGEDKPFGGLPPILTGEPYMQFIWESIALLIVGSPENQVDSASQLASLANDNERNAKLIIEEGGLQPLLRLLKEGVPDGQEAAAFALGVLAKDYQRVQELLKERAVETFVQILKMGPMKVQVKVAWALAQMVEYNDEAKDQFAQAGAILELVHLLGGSDTKEETSKPQSSLYKVVNESKEMAKSKQETTPSKPADGDDLNAEAQRRIRGLKPATVVSDSGKPTTVPESTGKTGKEIRNITFDRKNSPEYRGVGGFARHRYDREREDPKVKEMLKAEVARALWQLACGNVKNSKSITDTRALLCFANLMDSGEGDVRKNSVMAVMEIARAAEQDAELRRAAFKTISLSAKAVVNQLLKVIETGELELQIPCISAIGCLARIFPARITRVIAPLTAQLRPIIKDDQLVAEAALALQKFTNEDNYLRVDHSKTILEQNGAEHLVHHIFFSSNCKIEAMALLSLLAVNIGHSEELRKAGALKALESSARWPELQEDENNSKLLKTAIERLESAPRKLPEDGLFMI